MSLSAKPIDSKDLDISRLATNPTEQHKLTRTLVATKALIAKGADKDIRVN